MLSIITLNYKTPDLTISCVESVYAEFSNEFEKGTIEHIIVDNFSEDNSVEIMETKIKEKKFKHVYVIPNNENAGFGRGCNFGALHAKGEFLLFLNSDTHIGNRDFIKMMEFLSKHENVAIIGGKMKNFDGSPQLSAGKFYTLFYVFLMLLGLERFGFMKQSPKEITKVDWVSGGCMMLKKSIFNKLGGFDKNIFMYMEDMELCFRAKKHGYDTYFYPFVDILHKSQGSSNRSFAIVNIYKGILYFYKKYMPQWEFFLVQCLLRTKAIVLLLAGKFTGNKYLSSTYEKALGNI